MYGTIDTGAAISIISESRQKALFPNAKLESSKVLLKTYPGEKLPVLGEMLASSPGSPAHSHRNCGGGGGTKREPGTHCLRIR